MNVEVAPPRVDAEERWEAWPQLVAGIPLAALLGVAIGGAGWPLVGLGAVALTVGAAIASRVLGWHAMVLGVLFLTPLVPAVETGMFAPIGSLGFEVRAPLIVGLLAGAVLIGFRGAPRANRDVERIAATLLVLAGVGAVVALQNAVGAGELVRELAHGAGQPLVYAAALLVFAAYAARSASAGDWLLAAISAAVIAEAGIVAVELGSGQAVDPFRGLTRAQGTLGWNFLGALGMIGTFCALALRARTTDRGLRVLGAVAIAAGLGLVAAGVSRGALVALVVGAAYVGFNEPRFRGRLAVAAVVATVALLTGLANPVAGIWQDRASALGDGLPWFDRTATWVAGARMGADNPLTGLGSAGVRRAVETRPDYTETPFGDSAVIPHNVWILGLAESGIAYILLLLLLTWLVAAAVWARRRRAGPGDRHLIAALLGFGAISVINNLFTHPELMLPVLAILGILLARPASRPRPASQPAPQAA